jgi:hypothetical protein
VSRLVAESDVEVEAMNVAKKITDLSRPVIALGKAFFYSQIGLGTADAYR